MNPPKKLTAQQQAEVQAQALHHQSSQTFREFGTVEELLRHDALHTPVPPSIAQRLRESIGPVAPAPKPWWRRLFGG